MVSKKQIKIIFSALVLLISILAFIISDENSKLSTPFEKKDKTPTPSQDADQDVYEEEVLGQSILISQNPSSGDLEEVSAESANGQESEQIEETLYKIVKVVDGDTLDVEIEGKIERLRLIGIDTPETVDPRKTVQCFGIEASNKAKELFNGKFVTLESDETQGDRDKYKRLLRYVFLPNGTNFNLFMISEGYAHEYTYGQPYKYQAEFKQAEIDARNQNKGLWSSDTCSGNK